MDLSSCFPNASCLAGRFGTPERFLVRRHVFRGTFAWDCCSRRKNGLWPLDNNGDVACPCSFRKESRFWFSNRGKPVRISCNSDDVWREAQVGNCSDNCRNRGDDSPHWADLSHNFDFGSIDYFQT